MSENQSGFALGDSEDSFDRNVYLIQLLASDNGSSSTREFFFPNLRTFGLHEEEKSLNAAGNNRIKAQLVVVR